MTRYPVNKWPWDSSTRDQNPQQSSTDRQTESSKSKGPSRTVPRPLTDAQKFFSQTKYKRYPQNKNLLACCDFLLLRASFYYSPAMQLRPHRQQLLQHHATTTTTTKNLPRSRSPSARSASTDQHYRRRGPKLNAEDSNSRAKTERKKTDGATLIRPNPHNSKFLLQNQKDPKSPLPSPVPPKFIKITKIAVKYLEETVRWSSRRRSYIDFCNEREREDARWESASSSSSSSWCCLRLLQP